ncbi:MAG TPA: hypothetical protein VL688_03540 [Verrucomicrobiae bacterium]|jgi:hypothetical protein|nr:hypothetical protein [Verrucomicrobiae bacterium]
MKKFFLIFAALMVAFQAVSFCEVPVSKAAQPGVPDTLMAKESLKAECIKKCETLDPTARAMCVAACEN